MHHRHPDVTYVEAAAEAMPFENESFDSITCVYLFHELPSEVRKAVVKEMQRVLKPGGKVFFVDSAQSGEVPYERVLQGFTIIAHEPYYLDYTKTDLVSVFGDEGLQLDGSSVNWVSKCMTFTKTA
jgi:ubiquinone/menaquinone biosynthesis C-methylase UbiE